MRTGMLLAQGPVRSERRRCHHSNARLGFGWPAASARPPLRSSWRPSKRVRSLSWWWSATAPPGRQRPRSSLCSRVVPPLAAPPAAPARRPAQQAVGTVAPQPARQAVGPVAWEQAPSRYAPPLPKGSAARPLAAPRRLAASLPAVGGLPIQSREARRDLPTQKPRSRRARRWESHTTRVATRVASLAAPNRRRDGAASMPQATARRRRPRSLPPPTPLRVQLPARLRPSPPPLLRLRPLLLSPPLLVPPVPPPLPSPSLSPPRHSPREASRATRSQLPSTPQRSAAAAGAT